MSSTYERVVEVISKPSDARQDFEIMSLISWFRKRSKIMEKLKPELIKDIIRHCRYERHQRDSVIIRQGDRGECFYIILEGEISIYIFNKDKDNEDEGTDLSHLYVRDKDGNLDRDKLGIFVTKLNEGNPFGEVALINDDCIRTASIIANRTTDLVCIDKSLYERSVKNVLAQEFKEKSTFVHRNPLFSQWAPKYRKQLTMAMYKEVWPYESHLVRQGDPVSNMYFILSGQVEIQIDPTTHPAQYPKIYAANASEAEKFLKKTHAPRPGVVPEVCPSTSLRKRDSSSKSIRLCCLGLNESVGDVEILMELDSYLQTALCKERSEVLVLERKHYERLFVRRHAQTITRMREQLAVKLDTRVSLLPAPEDIPVLSFLRDDILARSRPPPPPEVKYDVSSVTAAEREFLNHKGPLIDMFGPGSVFHMIRVREKTKMKIRAKRRRHAERLKQVTSSQHVHAVTLPQSLLAVVQKAGASRELAAETEEAAVGLPSSGKSRDGPRSFRQIQSASRMREDGADATSESSGGEGGGEMSRQQQLQQQLEEEERARQSDDAAMSLLEARIRDWLTRDAAPHPRPQVAQLRRLELQEMEARPKPGNKVVIRRRRRPVTTPVISDSNPRQRERETLSDYNILLTR